MLKQVLKIINVVILLFIVFLSAFIIKTTLDYNLFNLYKLNIIILLVIVLINIFLFFVGVKTKFKIVSFIFNITILFIFGSAFYYINSFNNTIDKIKNNAKINNYSMSVVVLKDSEINSLEDIKNKSVVAPITKDKSNVNRLIEDIQKTKNININVKNGQSYIKEYENLLSGKNEIIILNSVYENIIALNYPNYENQIKKIYTLEISQEVKEDNSSKNSEVFNLYISGIDTYGSITSVARSDVNIIMTVNRNTNKILLTTIPRDSYVRIADGGNNEYDKLTHAGIYGVDTSIHTLENLYKINIDYYARVNFTSFIKILEELGEIEVYNEQEFSALHGEYHFPVGVVKLDSKKALAFVRERYSLASGDFDRGKNQQKVIEGIIKKITTKESILKANKIVPELAKSIQTNMSIKQILNMAGTQLSSQKEFNVYSQSLTGVGAMGLPSYAMPGYNLYVMQISDKSLEETRDNIIQVLEGK